MILLEIFLLATASATPPADLDDIKVIIIIHNISNIVVLCMCVIVGLVVSVQQPLLLSSR